MRIQFEHEATCRLLRLIWNTEPKKRTKFDSFYRTGDPDRDNALPILPIVRCHVEDFGVYLSGNTELPEDAEVFAEGLNPNERDEREIEADVYRIFGNRVPFETEVQIMNCPQPTDRIFIEVHVGEPALYLIQDALSTKWIDNSFEEYFES
jgi:hypothetical protein